MAEGPVVVPVSGGSGYNMGAIRITQWIVDPSTGVGAWTDVDTQMLIVADKRGDPVDTEEYQSMILGELRTIRECLEELMLHFK